ncbi:MAG: BrnA antitoxin family protein [Pyrinomonadaceae bacterium]|nr:BrnA antitoxin family protein [Pyrinomonadaceae bacterium]
MSKTTKNLTYTVTEEEYRTELAQGLTEDEVMKPGTYKVRRSPWAGKLKNTNKVKVSMYLDEVVVEYFRARAEKEHAAPYQTQINNELRRIMENDAQGNKSLENDILNNEEFLRALKEKLETV